MLQLAIKHAGKCWPSLSPPLLHPSFPVSEKKKADSSCSLLGEALLLSDRLSLRLSLPLTLLLSSTPQHCVPRDSIHTADKEGEVLNKHKLGTRGQIAKLNLLIAF